MEQVVLDVPDIDSRECERVVTTALINVPGVKWATAAHPSGVVGVKYDPTETNAAELREIVEAAGYRPTP